MAVVALNLEGSEELLFEDQEVMVVNDVVDEAVRVLALLIALDLLSSTAEKLRSSSGAIHPSVPVAASV